jgi:DNA-binding NarL/FixJ family response regulator
MSENPIKLVIVEDQQLLAQMLAAWVANQPDLLLVGCASDGEEGWTLCRTLRPTLALVDIELPKLGGLELAGRLLQQKPPIPTLTMSGFVDPYTIWRVCQSGAHGYVDKTQDVALLMEGIRAVAAGKTYFSKVFEQVKQDSLAQPQAFHAALTQREQAVLQRVVAGWDDRSIGTQFCISTVTVAAHRKHIRKKLDLHNDRQLVAYASRWGLNRTAGPNHYAPKRNPED